MAPLARRLPRLGRRGSRHREHSKYQAFHVAYHTGQIYSARHLLGEATPDN